MLALDEVVLRVGLQGLTPEGVAGHPGEHDNGDLRRDGPDGEHRLQPAGIGQREVDDHAADAAGAQPLGCVGDRADVHHLQVQIRAVAQSPLDEEGVVGVVLDQQQHAGDGDLRTARERGLLTRILRQGPTRDSAVSALFTWWRR